MKSLVVAAALVIGAGGGYAFAGAGAQVAGKPVLQLAALPPEFQVAREEGASLDLGRGKPQRERAEPAVGEDADEEVTGSLARPVDEADETETRGKPMASRAPAADGDEEEVTGSLSRPHDDRDEASDVRAKPASVRGPSADGEDADEVIGKSGDEDEERGALAPADSGEEYTSSLDRSAERAGKSAAPGKASGEGEDEERAFGDEPGKPAGEVQGEKAV